MGWYQRRVHGVIRIVRNSEHAPSISYTDCWGFMPAWRSEYSQLQHSKISPAEMDDCCCVCLVSKSNVRFTKCGHSCVCLTCASIVSNCPLCEAKIEGVKITEMPPVGE